MKKLHLGCGQRYFDGYVNIDYPLSEHSVQQSSVADEFHNLYELKYAAGTIAEVRLHHVFEHFSRAHACAMLAGWNSWIETGGTLHIEVPDFEKTAKSVLKRWSSDKTRSVGLRHIFGSQEAHWAVHFEGYTAKRLNNFLKKFGFGVMETKQTRYLDTFNLEMISRKEITLTKEQATASAAKYLSEFLVADVESERLMLQQWMKDYSIVLDKIFSGHG